MNNIEVNKIYKHYSGKLYKVIAIANDSENTSKRVIYKGLYNCPKFGPNPIWDRPYDMFAETVEIDGKKQFRFEKVNGSTFENEDIFHLGIKAIIKNKDDKILLLKFEKKITENKDDVLFNEDCKSYWDLPGGRIQIDEKIADAVHREVEEETGLTSLNNLHYITTIISNIRIPINKYQTCGLIYSFYSCNVDSDKIKLSSEHQYYEWTEKEKANELLKSTFGIEPLSFINLANI